MMMNLDVMGMIVAHLVELIICGNKDECTRLYLTNLIKNSTTFHVESPICTGFSQTSYIFLGRVLGGGIRKVYVSERRRTNTVLRNCYDVDIFRARV